MLKKPFLCSNGPLWHMLPILYAPWSLPMQPSTVSGKKNQPK